MYCVGQGLTRPQSTDQNPINIFFFSLGKAVADARKMKNSTEVTLQYRFVCTVFKELHDAGTPVF